MLPCFKRRCKARQREDGIRIDLANRRALACGAESPTLSAIASALTANGCAVTRVDAPSIDPLPDLLVLVQSLPTGDVGMPLPAGLDAVGQAMAQRGSGRIVLVVSALAAVPSRRFPDASVRAGAGVLVMRTLAMRLGPAVLVNAIGCGAVADAQGALVSGYTSMLSHVPGGQPGAIDDVVHAALFLCDPMNSYMTGQLLTVDGGWSAGYARNF